MAQTTPSVVMVLPFHTNYYCDYAKTFSEMGVLRKILSGTRRPIEGIPASKQIRQPLFGLWFYLMARICRPYRGESIRFATYPLFDLWALRRVRPGDWVFSSYGYANRCFRFARQNNGKTLLDAGNSHPQNFWEILQEEHQRWGCRVPPVSPAHHRRSLEMMKDVDWVLAPSRFVEDSFLKNGFSKAQILRIPYATDLSVFQPAPSRPANRPFTVINTGGLSLRKGTPYLLEALSLLKRKIPDLRILLTRQVSDSIRPILRRFRDLPIEWSDTLPPAQLARRLQSADLFILPSLEEGMARTALEAMACGLPVILTSHTGADDFVHEGVNGSVVGIRDGKKICEKALFWQEKISAGYQVPRQITSSQRSASLQAFHARLQALFDAKKTG